MPRLVTVAIVEEQPADRDQLAALLVPDPAIRVVSATSSAQASSEAVDVVLLGGPMPGLLGALAQAAEFGQPVVAATWTGAPTIMAAVEAGARGCLPRDCAPAMLHAALRAVADGGLFLSADLVDQFRAELAPPARSELSGLAPREIETLTWIASGFTQSQIARKMGLSQATVNTYAKRIRQKLNVGNKAELTRVAVEFGFVGLLRRPPAA